MAEKANTGAPLAPEEQIELKVAELGDAARRNVRTIAVIGGVVLLGVVGGLIWTQTQRSAEAKAGAALMQAQGQYFSGNFEQALSEFQTISSRYGSTASAGHANLFLGNCQLSLGRAAEAEASYRKVLGKAGSDPVLRTAAERGIASALHSQGKAADAAKLYLSAAEREGNPLQLDDYLAAGRAFSEAGDRVQAGRAFQEVINRFPENPRSVEARIRLEELKAGS